MAKMNYNRPNGGYERESWEKGYDDKRARSLKTGNWRSKYPSPVTVIKGAHDDHKAKVVWKLKTPHVWCCQCDVSIQELSYADYWWWKNNQNH
jgi:hypothetical protein